MNLQADLDLYNYMSSRPILNEFQRWFRYALSWHIRNVHGQGLEGKVGGDAAPRKEDYDIYHAQEER